MNPMGWYDGEKFEPNAPPPNPYDDSAIDDSPTPRSASPTPSPNGLGLQDVRGRDFHNVIVDTPPRMDSAEEARSPSQVPYAGRPVTEDLFPRSRTIAFDDNDEMPHRGMATGREGAYFPRTATHRSFQHDTLPFSTTTSTFPRTYSLRPTTSRKPDTRLSGFGGFPTPFEIIKSLVNKFAPNASRTLTQSLTMPRTATIGRTNTVAGKESNATSGGDTIDKEVPYISFAATVGRNSRFTGLTEEQMDELGGVEYRSLRILLYIVIFVSNVYGGLSIKADE